MNIYNAWNDVGFAIGYIIGNDDGLFIIPIDMLSVGDDDGLFIIPFAESTIIH